MSHAILESPVLKLNSNWAVIGEVNVRKAFQDAFAGAVTFLRFHEGFPTPYRIDDWLELPLREEDDWITAGGRMGGYKKVAAPRVVICVNFNRLIAKEQRCDLNNLLRRYKGRDAVTGKPLPRDKASREHVIPRSLGGPDGWDNEVPMHRKANSKRGNRDYAKLGLREPTILGAPPPLLPINSIVNRHGFPEWDLFKIPRPLGLEKDQ